MLEIPLICFFSSKDQNRIVVHWEGGGEALPRSVGGVGGVGWAPIHISAWGSALAGAPSNSGMAVREPHA